MLARRRALLLLALAMPLAPVTAPADGARRRAVRRAHPQAVRRAGPQAVRPAGPQAVRPAGPLGLPGHWRIAFDDEFSGRHLNHRLWSTGWFGHGITAGPSNLEQECEDPRQVHVHDGLRITAVARAETCGGHRQRYASGLITTDGEFSFTYGAIEARIWMPGRGSAIADWPAFWADGQHWPRDGEIDVVEGLGGRPCWHFHYSGGGPGGCATVRGAASGWHTYAADWEPGSIGSTNALAITAPGPDWGSAHAPIPGSAHVPTLPPVHAPAGPRRMRRGRTSRCEPAHTGKYWG